MHRRAFAPDVMIHKSKGIRPRRYDPYFEEQIIPEYIVGVQSGGSRANLETELAYVLLTCIDLRGDLV